MLRVQCWTMARLVKARWNGVLLARTTPNVSQMPSAVSNINKQTNLYDDDEDGNGNLDLEELKQMQHSPNLKDCLQMKNRFFSKSR